MGQEAERASILVHGATGFTGKLVCAALRVRNVRFAISGRNAARIEPLSESLGGVESHCVDIDDTKTLDAALEGRVLVSACAGPFARVGEPMLAAAIRAGVHYVDSTGEQSFVAAAVSKYGEAAIRRNVCAIPSMAYETALADWAAHEASSRLSRPPASIDIVYAVDEFRTTRGTKHSILAALSETAPRQFVDGRLVVEEIARDRRKAVLADGQVKEALSFPSPEAVLVPMHTRARTVRTFAVVDSKVILLASMFRKAAPLVGRVAEALFGGVVDGMAEGPTPDERARQTFMVLVEAETGSERAAVRVTGRDPYGLTAFLHAHAAVEALAGKLEARGVVAPSMAFPYERAQAGLSEFGIAFV